MPSITGKSLIDRAAGLLQDTTNVRWLRTELLQWLNDGQREVVLLKPEACVNTLTMSMASNTTAQNIANLPSTGKGLALIDVIRNINADNSPGAAIRVTSREVLDAQQPDWHSTTGASVKHYMFDPRNPKSFYVFPRNAGVGKVEVVVSYAPDDTNDTGATTGAGLIGLDDIYANALLDYILYRAYSKDAEYAQNAQLAVAHYTAFANSIGVVRPALQAINPNLLGGATGNPNVPRVGGQA